MVEGAVPGMTTGSVQSFFVAFVPLSRFVLGASCALVRINIRVFTGIFNVSFFLHLLSNCIL